MRQNSLLILWIAVIAGSAFSTPAFATSECSVSEVLGYAWVHPMQPVAYTIPRPAVGAAKAAPYPFPADHPKARDPNNGIVVYFDFFKVIHVGPHPVAAVRTSTGPEALRDKLEEYVRDGICHSSVLAHPSREFLLRTLRDELGRADSSFTDEDRRTIRDLLTVKPAPADPSSPARPPVATQTRGGNGVAGP